MRWQIALGISPCEDSGWVPPRPLVWPRGYNTLCCRAAADLPGVAAPSTSARQECPHVSRCRGRNGEASRTIRVMKRGVVSFVMAWLAVAPTLTHAATGEEEGSEHRTRRRSGPRYASYLANLPIGAFVDSLTLDQLSEIVVTDTKVAQSQQAVTQKLLVVYSEDFDQYTVYNRNIAELLRYNPGQFVNVLSRNDANWGSVGGLGPKYNTYLLDGLPIDSFVDAMSLDPGAFDRVEKQEGPASVLYPNYSSMDFAGNESPLAGTANFVLKDKVDADADAYSS